MSNGRLIKIDMRKLILLTVLSLAAGALLIVLLDWLLWKQIATGRLTTTGALDRIWIQSTLQ